MKLNNSLDTKKKLCTQNRVISNNLHTVLVQEKVTEHIEDQMQCFPHNELGCVLLHFI